MTNDSKPAAAKPEQSLGAFLANQIGGLSEREDRLRRALREIARQMTSEELEREHGSDGAPDYEGAYDAMILIARGALL